MLKPPTEAFKAVRDYCKNKTGCKGCPLGYRTEGNQIGCKELPCDWQLTTDEPAKPKATWIGKRIDRSHYIYTCSKCGTETKYRKTIYCHHCGSRMEEAT